MVKFKISLQLRGAMTWKPSGPCGFALLEKRWISPRRPAVFFGLEGGFRIHFFAVGVWCRKNRGQMGIFAFTDDHVFKLRSCVGSPSAILRRSNIIHHFSLNRDRAKTRVLDPSSNHNMRLRSRFGPRFVISLRKSRHRIQIVVPTSRGHDFETWCSVLTAEIIRYGYLNEIRSMDTTSSQCTCKEA